MTRSEHETALCLFSAPICSVLEVEDSRFHLSTRLRYHDREKDFDYPRCLLIHTRPGRRSSFGAEFGTADRFPCCDSPHAHPDGRSFNTLSLPNSTAPMRKTWGSRRRRPLFMRWRAVLGTLSREDLGQYTVREDHRTGFHCCQTSCHTVIGDWIADGAWKHGTFGKETCLPSLFSRKIASRHPQ